MRRWADFKNEIDYSVKVVSALGAYPLHLVLIAVFFKLEFYSEALFLVSGFIGVYALGVPIRLLFFQQRTAPPAQEQVGLSVTQSSFPSFHTTRLTFLTLFLSQFFLYEWDITLLFAAITVLVAYTRVYFKHHYLRDVVGGVLLGIVLFNVVSMLIS